MKPVSLVLVVALALGVASVDTTVAALTPSPTPTPTPRGLRGLKAEGNALFGTNRGTFLYRLFQPTHPKPTTTAPATSKPALTGPDPSKEFRQGTDHIMT